MKKNSIKIGMDNSSMKTNDTNKGTIDKEAQERMRARYMEIWNIIPEHYNDGTPIPIKKMSFDDFFYHCNKDNFLILNDKNDTNNVIIGKIDIKTLERMRTRYMEIWNIIPEHYNDGTSIPIKRISFDNLIYYCNKNNIPISGNIIPDDKTVQLARRMEMYYMMGTIINGNTLKSYTYTEIASQLSKSR